MNKGVPGTPLVVDWAYRNQESRNGADMICIEELLMGVSLQSCFTSKLSGVRHNCHVLV